MFVLNILFFHILFFIGHSRPPILPSQDLELLVGGFLTHQNAQKAEMVSKKMNGVKENSHRSFTMDQLSAIFRHHNIITVRILDYVGVKEFVRKIPSKAIFADVLRLYRKFIIEAEYVGKRNSISKEFFTFDSMLVLYHNSKSFREEFDTMKLQEEEYFDFYLTYVKENETHYTKDFSKYSGPLYQFPEVFVNEIKKYEQWERGINNPAVFRMIFYSSSIFTFAFCTGTDNIFDKLWVLDKIWVHTFRGESRPQDEGWIKYLLWTRGNNSLFDHLLIYLVISTIAPIFPEISDFLIRNRRVARALRIGTFIYMAYGNLSPTLLLLTVTGATLFQIFYVARKRKNIEKFSKHQNATVCFAKCVFLMILQLALGCVMFLMKHLDYRYRLDPKVAPSIVSELSLPICIHLTICVGNLFIFLFLPNKAFEIVSFISEESWRSLINSFSKSSILILLLGFVGLVLGQQMLF